MRYSRQVVFKKIGDKGQKTIRKSKVAIIGLGGLGTNSANLLARAGIGGLILVDRDVVELSNLQRQTLFTEDDIGKPKAVQVEKHLKEINPEVEIKVYSIDLTKDNVKKIKTDLILDCTDNLNTRYLINEYAIKAKIPWVHATCVKDLGEVFSVMPGKACYRCVYGDAQSLESCNSVGVLNTIVTMTSAIQVNEALKILLGKEYCMNLIRINIWKPELKLIKVRKNPKCNACGKR